MVVMDGKHLIVSPDEELTIRTVNEFYTQTKDSLEVCEGILLSLIGVIEIDTAGFQILIALKKEIMKQNKTFEIVGMSTEVDEIISLYGAGSFFQEVS